jgi:hypothetical protein
LRTQYVFEPEKKEFERFRNIAVGQGFSTPGNSKS